MSQSISDLRYELKSKGNVTIPQTGPIDVVKMLSFPGALALMGIGVWWYAPFNWGIFSVVVTLFCSAVVVLVLGVQDLRKHVTVTSTHLRTSGSRPIPWTDIESIRAREARFVISIQLTVDGFLRHFDQGSPDEGEIEFLKNAGDRIVVWTLPETFSQTDLRFLQEQVR